MLVQPLAKEILPWVLFASHEHHVFEKVRQPIALVRVREVSDVERDRTRRQFHSAAARAAAVVGIIIALLVLLPTRVFVVIHRRPSLTDRTIVLARARARAVVVRAAQRRV